MWERRGGEGMGHKWVNTHFPRSKIWRASRPLWNVVSWVTFTELRPYKISLTMMQQKESKLEIRRTSQQRKTVELRNSLQLKKKKKKKTAAGLLVYFLIQQPHCNYSLQSQIIMNTAMTVIVLLVCSDVICMIQGNWLKNLSELLMTISTIF